ncbi:hypothetical protein EV401DRAFT_2226317 [Pisolithus croceorrhizus]|nr:hypothetical protein EV401DRAFT_2226317 [Pisolithus croceorrhizus]
MAAPLLAFHKEILEKIHDPSTSELLLLARGLGLRRMVCTLMKIYDSPQNLVLLVNATPEEEAAIGEELGIMGCRKPGLRVIGYEMGKRDRQDLYKKGGLFSVTSRILVVDMLQSDIPIELITGILVLRAERVTALALEAFVVRLYREKNCSGFLKAFSDQPESITSGLSPLRNIMKELHLRTVYIYPRFHETVKSTLENRKADVIELYQHMTESMQTIHHAIVQCMTMTLSELKRSHAMLELDDLTIESAYFKSFDAVVRRQLDPVWHKVGPKTKQLVGDLSTLRRLLTYLLSYDAFSFYEYLETLIACNTTSTFSGEKRLNQSPWMLTDAANIIIQTAKRRCYTLSKKSADRPDDVTFDDQDGWDALDDMEGFRGQPVDKPKKSWIPEGLDPVAEELPKWELLADVLQEVEEEILRHGSLTNIKGSNTVLVMTSSSRASALVSEFLSNMDLDAPKGKRGRKMMEKKLRQYLFWKSKLASQNQGKKNPSHTGVKGKQNAAPIMVGKPTEGPTNQSLALKKKEEMKQARGANRRRVRGGAPSATSKPSSDGNFENATVNDDIEEIEAIVAAPNPSSLTDILIGDSDFGLLERIISGQLQDDFDTQYGLLTSEETVVVRVYSDDSDDRVLAELQPKFVVMFEPSLEFVRRVEVYKNSHPGLGVRVYFMIYQLSCEEHKYLAALRREKDSFERLIKERGAMLNPVFEDQRPKAADQFIRTISSRLAGGRKELGTQPSQVIVDMREFRSTLPSLLHASGLQVVPATLTVGDYILTPEICVERKSIPDLISSFNSGRLYTQCELMSVHYKQPILLIEFEENKAFSLELIAETAKSYAKPTAKATSKKDAGPSETDRVPSLQSKVVLLTLHFPRVRIIWSSSPYATADIFNDLKANNPEPDLSRAIAIGAEEDPDVGAGVNTAAEDLLRCLPGISAKNVKYVMSKVNSVREFCEVTREEIQGILGVEPGNRCWEFMHGIGNMRS